MAFTIHSLAPEHAEQAAAIHVVGQKDTFLTGLGPAFLRALYAEMAMSSRCYGFVALDGDRVIGVVTGTVDSSAVFKELIYRRGLMLAWPVLVSMLRRPRLVAQVFETLTYPGRHELAAGEAELFFIGVRPDRRREGVGAALFGALASESVRRGMRAMGLTVDASNDVARRFYRDRGMVSAGSFALYGRPMYWYRLSLEDDLL